MKLLSLMVATLSLTACGGPSHTLPTYATHDAKLEALELELPMYPGEQLASLAQYAGKVLLIDVWAAWCKPCRTSLPMLQSLAEKNKDQGLIVITINIDDDTSALPSFVQDMGLTLPVWHDPGGKVVASRLRFTQAPSSYLIGRSGLMRSMHAGFDDETIAALQSEIERLLQEPGEER